MRDAALAYTAASKEAEGWSDQVGLFFHCYPWCSVNSLHMHILDMAALGPTYAACEHKNLRVEHVIAVIEKEIEADTQQRESETAEG